MVIMAIDHGDIRTGVAVCDKLEMMAYPLCVIKQSDDNLLCDEIIEKAKEENVGMFVVGLPKNMDGTCGESAEKCKNFASLLSKKSGLKVEMWDERLTTVISYRSLNSSNVYGKKSKSLVDAVAASTILQGFIDRRKINCIKP